MYQFKETYSNGSIHHHGTNGEHKERDGKAHTSILCRGNTVVVIWDYKYESNLVFFL